MRVSPGCTPFDRRRHKVSNQETERTAGGLVGKLAGKAKEAAGSVIGNDDLAREGRLQDAQSEQELEARREEAEARQREQEAEVESERAETERERERLQHEVAEERREEAAERDRQAAEQRAQTETTKEQARAGGQGRAG